MNESFRQTSDYSKIVKKSKILITDDLEFNLDYIKQILKNIGFCKIKTAFNGIEALKVLENFDADLIIIDLVMPEMDGFELCSEIRKITKFNLVPILVQTALEDSNKKNDVFSIGANDVVNKPIDKNELAARTKVLLENYYFVKELDSFRKKTTEELIEASKLHESTLPSKELIKHLEKKYNLKIESLYKPSSALGGDSWGITSLSDDKFLIYITDFSGHGIKSALNSFRFHTLVWEYQSIADNPALFMEKINLRLCTLLEADQFATMFCGVVDLKRNTLTYCCGGSTSPIVFDSKEKTGYKIDPSGFPIGITTNASYPTKIIDFHPGSMIILYSDALTETLISKDTYFTDSNIRKASEYGHKLSNDETFASNVFNQLYKKQKKSFFDNLNDDLTICIFYRKNEA